GRRGRRVAPSRRPGGPGAPPPPRPVRPPPHLGPELRVDLVGRCPAPHPRRRGPDRADPDRTGPALPGPLGGRDGPGRPRTARAAKASGPRGERGRVRLPAIRPPGDRAVRRPVARHPAFGRRRPVEPPGSGTSGRVTRRAPS